ncbi:MAG TPA: heterodisulfide reductase-related iron-sulfur binding cluster [Candidatus Limnocylindrales bacterium]|nr:heterodisulfide reductase-related iron-sulfur binding cluster [Candidatus Limnocylindrales bacterium]
MLDASVTREVFEGLSPDGELAFYLLAALATTIFVVGLGLRLRKYLRGRREDRVGSLTAFIGRAIGGVRATATSETVRKRDAYAGIFHAAVMWGFIVLFIGTVILTIDTDIVGLIAPQYHFFNGAFYVVYSFILDLLGLALLVGLAALAWRRARFHKRELDYARVDLGAATTDRRPFVFGDWLFLGWLGLLGTSGFIVEGVRIVAHDFPWFEAFSPVGEILARVVAFLGLSAATAGSLHPWLWWFHAIAALGFVAYIPYAKAIHMLTDGANLALRSPLAGRRLPVIDPAPRPLLAGLAPAAAGDSHIGIRDLADFSWKQLLDFDACTKCGRCHAACPAVAAGAPLSPRDLILDLRQQADASWAVRGPGMERRSDVTYGGARADAGEPVFSDVATPVTRGGLMAGGLVKAETLWACTTCLACVEACPVGIEHVPAIVGMRRSLVDQGAVEPGLQTVLTSLAKQGNSFSQSGRGRAKWADGLPTPLRDARREEVDWLWFVGDFASFDVRVQEATRLVARVLQAAGVDFGILFEGERNAGNDVRRVGEEGLFEILVEHNVGQLEKARFRRIVTTDPHTLNTLRHEYPDFGGRYEVWHYSQLLAALFDDGLLRTRRPIARRATYHDPCYLARYNDVTRAPRDVLAAIGARLVEMPRNGTNTFCCGAGGGRIWMDDSGLRERPSEQRMREAAALERVTDFVTACPKDLTMYTAAAKATGLDDRLVVSDLIELVARAIDLGDEVAEESSMDDEVALLAAAGSAGA